MDHYQEIANTYYAAFEGTNFSPRPWIRLLLLFVLFLGAAAAWKAQPYIGNWAACIAIVVSTPCVIYTQHHRQMGLKARHGEDIRAARIRQLETLFGRTASEFSTIAQEASLLDTMHQTPFPGKLYIRRWMYNHNLTYQIVPLSISILALFIATFPSVFNLNPDQFFELIETTNLWRALLLFLLILAYVYALVCVFISLAKDAIRTLQQLIFSWGLQSVGIDYRLRYLIRDLVNYHDPRLP